MTQVPHIQVDREGHVSYSSYSLSFECVSPIRKNDEIEVLNVVSFSLLDLVGSIRIATHNMQKRRGMVLLWALVVWAG